MSISSDHKRFKDIVKGKIKENFKKYISHGEMIGKQEKDFVKIPIPSIDIPTFRYGPKQKGGVGQGPGEPGDGVGEAGSGEGKAGNMQGDHVTEIEVSFEELADILGESLSLPNIKPKGNQSTETESRKYTGIAPVGPNSLKHFKRSFKEALKREISTGTFRPDKPLLVPIQRDLRFRTFKTIQKPLARAVVIYMMDVSGSMGEEQKQIVRLQSFWINTWLKKNYKGLETRFIIHDAAAREVDEQTFFSTSESGGTLISSAYKLCQKIIQEDYKETEWNIYPFHFSDGDNWSSDDTKFCVKLLKDFFVPRVNMFGYAQVESKYGSGQFLKDLEREFPEHDVVVTSQIPNRESIARSIQDFLGRGA